MFSVPDPQSLGTSPIYAGDEDGNMLNRSIWAAQDRQAASLTHDLRQALDVRAVDNVANLRQIAELRTALAEAHELIADLQDQLESARQAA